MLRDLLAAEGSRIGADLALEFAAKLKALGAPGRKAGSEQLVADSPGDTPVKVSCGEFTEIFYCLWRLRAHRRGRPTPPSMLHYTGV
jgi:hypothetical protein